MNLGTLLQTANCQYQNHDRDLQTVQGITTDSRACKPGDLFIGMPGSQVDGSQFASDALDKGAIAAIVADTVTLDKDGLIRVSDVVTTCAEVAAAFYGFPARQMKLVGVTGTNGKTTTTHLIEFLLQPHYPTALFGTLYSRWQGYTQTAAYTTPFAPFLQAQLKQALDDGCQASIMEVSSHALDQKRVWGCPFEVAVFTNLTQDHLDYHRNLDDYFQAKALLFNRDYLQGRAVINLDDPYGQKLAALTKRSEVWTYSLENQQADFYTENLTYSPNGVQGTLHTPAGAMAFNLSLVGSFNVYNAIAAIAACLHLGISLEDIGARLPAFTNVPGRVERVQVSPAQDITVVVDYAHTPDSLENILKAMRPFTQRELVCVFGCGGDRDRTKRPLMGEIATRLADRIYVTSDNPRTEEPNQILQDILAGIPTSTNGALPVTVEVDRRLSIQMAIANAQPGDTIAIAGKGHEDYQILGKEKIHFDDREEAQVALKQRLGI
ncbi:UDP-N-acetylmuramoyl-L-alanyl-D-glutamate--2,6-diaminopimelate ligase [Pseudanabaena sp. PCC 6802]|uniref:UDP-N-acetylmuramoyl-L-alanyl-D-glutamate--2, 6-diaminopimelate ligase n=1 Tax=Pseudanabaena sp. PCC 6802 TaxID=118173 RepID=UPI0003497365|nr:UDP-N-acetylmuramoyl-L-alanyl-D-glutamate--2,6-diaminopimelate ligase [Pseudanabaena sp. PCC 6802]